MILVIAAAETGEQGRIRAESFADRYSQALLNIANVGQNSGVVDSNDKNAFIAVVKTSRWDREKFNRSLA